MFKGLNSSFALLSSRKNNKISVAYVGGSTKEIVSMIGSPIKKLLGSITEHIIKYSVKKANYVQYVAKYLVNEYPTEGKYIVLSSVKIPPVEDAIKIQRRNKLENTNRKDVLNIGIIGYVNNKIKGMDTAIKSLALLDNSFKLSILGKGDNSKLLKLAHDLNVSERVKFCGTLPGGEQVLKWLDDIDIYIQPSLTEGMPRATIEAMSRGCPVIASDVGGLKDLVNPEWRHKPGDYRELASLVNKLSNNNDLCKEKVDKTFSIVRQYEETIVENAYDNFFTMITADFKNRKGNM